MKCLKIGRHHCFLFLFSSFVSIVFCSLFLVSPSFAIDDVVVTFTNQSSSSSNGSQIFSGVTTSNYQYIKVSLSPSRISTASGSNLDQNLGYFNMSCSSGYVIPAYSEIVYQIPNRTQASCRFGLSPSFSSGRNWSELLLDGETLTFTLTNEEPYAETSCPDEPSGELAITSNGTYDVTNYASVDVDVPETVVQGDYHNDLQDLKHSVIICGAILLVIYFFYCIYRMFFRTLGGV